MSESTPLVVRNGFYQPSRARSAATDRRGLSPYFVAIAVLVALGIGFVSFRVSTISTVEDPTKYLCDPDTKQDSGYIKLPNKVDDHYFYWYFESRSSPATDPLVLWLTGGPGGSSIMAMLAENGPCRILPDVTTEINPYSWTTKANVVWLDQPTSVGFSHGGLNDHDFNETNVGENIYWFLQGFLEKHPELLDREFFVTGESYGGHYVPVAAHYIWEKNSENSSDGGVKINLQGIAIGNGLTNPTIQYLYNADMANNAYNISLLTPTQVRQMRADAVECVALTSECQQNLANCAKAQSCWQEKLIRPFAASERNRYDIRQWCHPDFPLCYDFSSIHAYLDSHRVREMLHVDPGLGPWLEINRNVTQTFVADGDWSMSYHTYVADLLNDNLRVVIYAGDADLMCNWIGNQAWTLALEWKGKDGFNAAEERPFTHPLLSNKSSSVDAGVVRSFENFAFVRVCDAGHMVPMDQPAVALALLNKFLANEDL